MLRFLIVAVRIRTLPLEVKVREGPELDRGSEVVNCNETQRCGIRKISPKRRHKEFLIRLTLRLHLLSLLVYKYYSDTI